MLHNAHTILLQHAYNTQRILTEHLHNIHTALTEHPHSHNTHKPRTTLIQHSCNTQTTVISHSHYPHNKHNKQNAKGTDARKQGVSHALGPMTNPQQESPDRQKTTTVTIFSYQTASFFDRVRSNILLTPFVQTIVWPVQCPIHARYCLCQLEWCWFGCWSVLWLVLCCIRVACAPSPFVQIAACSHLTRRGLCTCLKS